ncbi:MAG: hypothetical protein ACJAYF_003557 [Arenicella sp.]|jgi:hypothetical protein
MKITAETSEEGADYGYIILCWGFFVLFACLGAASILAALN